MKIREGRIEDAPFLSGVVMEAIGRELAVELAGSEKRLPLLYELFTRLASVPDSQYSYKNALIATTDDGIPAGGIIAYDGADLHRLRHAFFTEANEVLGWNVTEAEMETWEDETGPDEIYIDSLYVVPEWRDKGVASALFKGIEKRFERAQKPLGLLVEPENHRALEKYLHWGFHKVGISDFFRSPMIHMQRGLFRI